MSLPQEALQPSPYSCQGQHHGDMRGIFTPGSFAFAFTAKWSEAENDSTMGECFDNVVDRPAIVWGKQCRNLNEVRNDAESYLSWSGMGR